LENIRQRIFDYNIVFYILLPVFYILLPLIMYNISHAVLSLSDNESKNIIIQLLN